MVKIFYDVETTGLNWKRHSIHQLAGLIEVDGVVVETFDYRLRPHDKAEIDEAALKCSGITTEQVRGYPYSQNEGYREFCRILKKHGVFGSKSVLVGYNNRHFDDFFLETFFELNKGSLFAWFAMANSLDVMVLASQYILERRPINFKLKRVAEALGIFVDETKLHDAIYDIELTRKIYRIVTNLDMEL